MRVLRGVTFGLVLAVVLVAVAGCPLPERMNTLWIVNESADLVTELRVVFSGDPQWSGNWLPEDLDTGEARQFVDVENAKLDILVVVNRPAPNDQYVFLNQHFFGGRTYQITVTDDDAELVVVPRPIPVKASN
jgi:hypothetical protein